MNRSRRSIAHVWALIGLALALALAGSLTEVASAQQGQPAPQVIPSVPDSREPEGFVAEPNWLERVTVFADRHLSGGGSGNGFYVNSKSPVPGAGWLTLGPGYRHWYNNDAVMLDTSAGVSWRGYKMVQARAELPTLLGSRLLVGTQYRFQDFRSVKFYGEGPDSPNTALSVYRLQTQNISAYATVRPVRQIALGAQVGWLEPALPDGPSDEPSFTHSEVSLLADGRDFPDHPTRGGLLRLSASRFTDRDRDDSSFDRFESEAAGYLPLASSRVVVAVRGWLVASDTKPGQSVPFYLQPSLGGGQSLRSFSDYRFHDRHMLVANAELRVALTTHLDVAGFVDAGSVAARVGDLRLAERSYGAGLRFHTRRDAFLRVDVAHGREGWRAMFGLNEALNLSRLSRRHAPAPFVP